MSTQTQVDSEQWRKILTEGHRPLGIARHLYRHIPSAPRCKVCGNPFGGVGGRVFAVAGYTRSRKNPNLCSRCCDTLPPGGAEVDIAVLFADVRGSTGLGEHAGAGAFAEQLNRFYAVATAVLLKHDGLIDKMIGDEVMALFIPGISGPDYRRRAVEAALDVMRSVGYGSGDGPWLSLGIGVNAGTAYVGNVGPSGVVDFTALGDTVNVAARMQEIAGGGEVVIAEQVHEDLASLVPGARRQTFELRGRQEPLEALVAAP
jgi:adenylate cyclase